MKKLIVLFVVSAGLWLGARLPSCRTEAGG